MNTHPWEVCLHLLDVPRGDDQYSIGSHEEYLARVVVGTSAIFFSGDTSGNLEEGGGGYAKNSKPEENKGDKQGYGYLPKGRGEV